MLDQKKKRTRRVHARKFKADTVAEMPPVDLGLLAGIRFDASMLIQLACTLIALRRSRNSF